MVERIREDGVDFVSLQFFDLLGVPKEVIIPAVEPDDVFQNGIWFDGSSIEGFARIQESDLFLKPDMDTYAIVPWLQEKGKTARVICDIYKSDGEPYEDDPRYILKNVTREAKERRFQYNVGPEMEFYMFRQEEGLKLKHIDYGGYFELSSYEGYNVLKEIIKALGNFGINVETSHHEVGRGQYEIDFEYGDALATADRLLTLKYTVKKIAQMYNIRATFMPKPIMGIAGSGMHTHQSLFDLDSGANLFYDEKDKYHLSRLAYQFIAGQMAHIKAMAAIICPTVNSYKRLVTGYEAPVYITWGSMNRTTLIRIPNWFKNKHNSARIELRCSDPSSNPYLAFAAMLKAGMDGIEQKMTPPEPFEENIFDYDSEKIAEWNIDTLPTSLDSAIDYLKADKLLAQTLGKHLFQKYISIKSREVMEYKQQVSDWEIEKYIDMF